MAMPLGTIINIFLLASIVAILMLGIVLNIKYAQSNVYRRFLVSMFVCWALVMSFVYGSFFAEGFDETRYNSVVASMEVLLLGIPCFFSLVSYPLIVVCAPLLKVKAWLVLMSPLMGALFVYFAWHYLAGYDSFTAYETVGDILANITTVPAILRVTLILLFMVYVMVILWNIWKIVPVYNKYVQDNIADSDYNVSWVRRVVVHIAIVGGLYFLVLFTNSIYVNLLYLLSLVTVFGYIVEISSYCKTSEDIEILNIRWSLSDGWYINSDVEDLESCEDIGEEFSSVNYEEFGREIDMWMNVSKPYTRVDFTIKDILQEFPYVNQAFLKDVFRSKDETFQSYVRRHRINHACKIIDCSEGRIYPKQIYSYVGFSHYSSFSRAFVAVMGVSPSDYIKS